MEYPSRRLLEELRIVLEKAGLLRGDQGERDAARSIQERIIRWTTPLMTRPIRLIQT